MFNNCLVLISLVTLANGMSYDFQKHLIENELVRTQNDHKLGSFEKYLKINALNRVIDHLVQSREHELQIKFKKISLDQWNKKLKIYNKYLGSKTGGSAFNLDFHTMRY